MVLRMATNVGAGKKGRDAGLAATPRACKLILPCMHVTIHLNWGSSRFTGVLLSVMLCFYLYMAASPYCMAVNLVRSGRKQPQLFFCKCRGQARHPFRSRKMVDVQ